MGNADCLREAELKLFDRIFTVSLRTSAKRGENPQPTPWLDVEIDEF